MVGVACLWAPLAYGLGASYIVQYELEQVGLQWSNIGELAVRREGRGGEGRGGGGETCTHMHVTCMYVPVHIRSRMMPYQCRRLW